MRCAQSICERSPGAWCATCAFVHATQTNSRLHKFPDLLGPRYFYSSVVQRSIRGRYSSVFTAETTSSLALLLASAAHTVICTMQVIYRHTASAPGTAVAGTKQRAVPAAAALSFVISSVEYGISRRIPRCLARLSAAACLARLSVSRLLSRRRSGRTSRHQGNLLLHRCAPSLCNNNCVICRCQAEN